MRNLGAGVLMVAMLALSDGRCAAESEPVPPDSGVFGVVPHYAEDLAFVERGLDSLKKELASATDSRLIDELRVSIAEKQTSIENMQNLCVEAFDPASELPTGYSWDPPAIPPAKPPGAFKPCTDRRFPRNFMTLLASVACAGDGAFRLPLAPGRYAVFVGHFLVGHEHGPYPWWEFVEVKPHEWKQLGPRKDNNPWGGVGSPGTGCEQDSDCSNGLVCRSTAGTRICQGRRLSRPPNYDSGVRGVVGPLRCGQISETQCVEAFREHSDYMVTCGLCIGTAFEMPLAPGRYTLEFGTGPQDETVTVEVAPNEWKDLYLFGAKPGQESPKCPPHS